MRTSQEEFMNRLTEIQGSYNPKMTMLPEDEPRFIIDSNTREISIPDEFTFLGVLKDTGAETIYFEIDRYFDDVDLSTKICIIQFAGTGDGKTAISGIYPVTDVDVDTVSGKIIFGWTINNEVTFFKGDVKFSIRFYTVEEGDDGKVHFTYCFNTLTASLPILDTLDVTDKIDPEMSTLFEEWEQKIQTLYSKVNESVANVKNGTTFIPSVKNGVLSWQNDGGLENPSPVNIQGPAYTLTSEDKNEIVQSIASEQKDGGYYTPTIQQLSANTAKVTWGASQSEMPSIESVVLNLPSGPQGEPGPTGSQGETGEKGNPGENGLTPTIGENGNWYIGNEDTGKPSRGEQGPKGDPGTDGKDGEQGPAGSDGITPTIGENGNWFLGEFDTGKPSRGIQGEKGDPGSDGEQGPQGPQGLQGPQGPQGPAYTLTAEDTESIVEAVLAKIPNGDEVSY